MLNITQNPYKENSNLYPQLEAMNIIKLNDNLSVIKTKNPLSKQKLTALAPKGCISEDIVYKWYKSGFKVKHYEYLINSNVLNKQVLTTVN